MQALVKLIYPLIFILIFQSCKNITNSEEPKLISVFGTVSLTTETESFPLNSVVVIMMATIESKILVREIILLKLYIVN